MSTEERVKVLRDAPPNSWIAFSENEDRVVATASSYEEAVSLAEAQGEEDPVLMKTPDEWVPLVLSARSV